MEIINIPNQITPDYWQKQKVKTWVEGNLYLLEDGICFAPNTTKIPTPRVDRFGTSILQGLNHLEKAARFISIDFDGDEVRAQAFLIAVGYHGINPEAVSYDQLWNTKPATQEAA